MSYVIAAPEMMTAAAADLTRIGSTLTEEHTAAVASTAGLIPAGADEVSAGIAQLFSRYTQGFQGLAGRAAVFHDQFAQHLAAGAHSYASTEAIDIPYLRWLYENAGVYVAVSTLFEELRSNSIFFQILHSVLEPLRALVGIALLIGFFVAVGILGLLSDYLGKFGL